MCDFDWFFGDDDVGDDIEGYDADSCNTLEGNQGDGDRSNEEGLEKDEEVCAIDGQESDIQPRNSHLSFGGRSRYKYMCEKCGYTWWSTYSWVTYCKSFSCTGKVIQVDSM